ncbi:MAG: hypothetical protein IT376_06985 [Polyangiaceae bacterium]|nr:hypothetical protein [Polyangiaceae bacterium]
MRSGSPGAPSQRPRSNGSSDATILTLVGLTLIGACALTALALGRGRARPEPPELPPDPEERERRD